MKPEGHGCKPQYYHLLVVKCTSEARIKIKNYTGQPHLIVLNCTSQMLRFFFFFLILFYLNKLKANLSDSKKI